MLGKKLINSGPSSSGGANPSGYFNTVLYTGNRPGTQRIGGYINRGATGFAYNKYITFPDMGGFTSNTSDSDGALSIWINFDSIPASSSNYYTLIDRGNPNSFSSTYQALELLVFGTSNTNQVEFRFRRGFGGTNYDPSSYTSARATVAVGTWYNLVVSYVASTKTATFYLNSSTAIGSYSLTSSSGGRTIDSGFNIGTYANSSSYSAYAWDGMVDQFRIFNRELTTTEVTTLYGETFASASKSVTDIFNDGSAVALYQLDGNANDTGGVSGKFGSAAIFNGSNSKIELPSALSNGSTTTAQTISFWFNVDSQVTSSTSNNEIMSFAYSGGSTGKIALGSTTGNFSGETFSVSSDVTTQYSYIKDTIPAGWNHAVVQWETNKWQIYINGSSKSVYTFGTNEQGNWALKFGHRSIYYYNGKLDDIRIYSDQLTSGEITAIYNNTTASIPTDNLIAYYKLNGDARDEQQLYDGTATNVTYAYNGIASNVTYQEATNFTPDLIWIKNRDSSSYPHVLTDSVRGNTKYLQSDSSSQELTSSNGIISFDSNGFSLGDDGYFNGGASGANNRMVAWCFNAGTDAAATNNDGTISSTVKANQKAGFSIATFTTPTTNNFSVAHGLDYAPELVLLKSRSGGSSWTTYSQPTGATKYLFLNTTAAATTSALPFNNTAPTDSVINLGSATVWYGTSADWLAYSFHSVDGIQKVGSYTGNGSTNGTMVETGFEPAWIMIKGLEGDRWLIADNKRHAPVNNNAFLDAQSTHQESALGTGNGVTFLSNGFQLATNDNALNGTNKGYIYLAIAADPDTTTPTVDNSFDVVTYTGTGAAQDIETDFSPDLCWIKDRDTNYAHQLYDTVRGATKKLHSNTTAAEATDSTGLTAFNSNGFTISTNVGINTNNNDYVAWCWKAGDHDDNLPQINTEGSIDSIVSVNDEAGFSIVTWTGNGLDATVGTGLSSQAELVITKGRANLATYNNWTTYHKDLSTNHHLYLNTTDSEQNGAGDYFRDAAFTSSVIGLGDDIYGVNVNNTTMVAYCFTSITGYQKIGSYTGTNGAGNFIQTDFKPRFLLTKRANGASGGGWLIFDSVRGTNKRLYPSLSNSEYTDSSELVTFNSNGFTMNTGDSWTNNSLYDYIYLAIK